MKQFLILIATIFISATAVSAQTVTKDEPSGRFRNTEAVKSVESSKRRERPRASLVVKLGPSTTYIKNGLSLGEIVRLLGQPASVSERRDGARRLITYTFARSEGRILVAEFEDGVLVNSRTRSNESLVQNSEMKR
jgi:hypothetical protein